MTPTRSDADRLREAKALIAHPTRWCKGELTDHDGRRCAAGAAIRVGAPYKWLRIAAGEPNERSAISRFNDAPETTHADVMALYDRAIAFAENASSS